MLSGIFFLGLTSVQNGKKKIRPKILSFYSNSLPLIFFLVFQGFDWRSDSVDPNPWSWMSGSIREGIGKDGCSERDQFSRIQMRVEFRTN